MKYEDRVPDGSKTRVHRPRWPAYVLCMLVLVLAVGLLIRGIRAYYTDKDLTNNITEFGDVHIEAWEPSFPTEDVKQGDPDGVYGVPDECELLTPYEEIAKDPRIKNVGTNDAIVFFKVTVPAEVVSLKYDDGTSAAYAEEPIFWLKLAGDSVDTHANHFNSEWIELTTLDNRLVDEASCNNEGRGYTFIFGYHARLVSGDETVTLFDKMQNKKYGSRVIDPDEIEQIRVEAYAIQADEIQNGGDIDTMGELDEATLTVIYERYINQNKTYLTKRSTIDTRPVDPNG